MNHNDPKKMYFSMSLGVEITLVPTHTPNYLGMLISSKPEESFDCWV